MILDNNYDIFHYSMNKMNSPHAKLLKKNSIRNSSNFGGADFSKVMSFDHRQLSIKPSKCENSPCGQSSFKRKVNFKNSQNFLSPEILLRVPEQKQPIQLVKDQKFEKKGWQGLMDKAFERSRQIAKINRSQNISKQEHHKTLMDKRKKMRSRAEYHKSRDIKNLTINHNNISLKVNGELSKSRTIDLDSPLMVFTHKK